MGKISYEGRLEPQMAAALRKQVELAADLGEMHKLPVGELRRLYDLERRYWNEDAPEVNEVIETTVAGPAGPIPIRYYFPTPARPLPVLVYLHGGGWIVGNLDTHDKIMRLLALRSGAAVVGVDYRLSPEHKFPTAIEETLAVLAYLRRHGAAHGIATERVALGGDSAGANMSVAAALLLRSRGEPLPECLLLFYGSYGLRDSCSRRLYGGPEDGMGEEDLDFYTRCYLRGEADLKDPRFDVLQGDFQGFPPTFIGAAEYDPLVDDSLTLAKLLEDAGGRRELRVYAGVLHGFIHLSRMVDKAAAAITDAATLARSCLFS